MISNLEPRSISQVTLASCTLGFDIKIDPNGDPYVIEINGENSGLKGLEMIAPGSAAIRQRKMQIARFIARSVFGDRDESGSNTTTGVSQNKLYANHQINRLFLMPASLEALTKNKISQKDYISDSFKALYQVWDGTRACVFDFIIKILQQNHFNIKYPYVVAKGSNGSHGNNVKIFHITDIQEIVKFLSNFTPGETLLEEFVPSRKIDGAEDGCMRYLIDFMTITKNQKTSWWSVYEGAYWRISPGFFIETTDPDIRYKSNLTGAVSAIPTLANETDQSIAQTAVYSTINNLTQNSDLFASSDWVY